MVSGLRGLLLAIVVLGALGLIAELLLLEHYEEWTQWLPLVALACVLPGALALWLRPGLATVRVFRALMVGTLLLGVVGLVLHFAGNREFELERNGDLRGWTLTWESLRGATPALAPGAMIQLALIGLALTWRYEVRGRRSQVTGGGARDTTEE